MPAAKLLTFVDPRRIILATLSRGDDVNMDLLLIKKTKVSQGAQAHPRDHFQGDQNAPSPR